MFNYKYETIRPKYIQTMPLASIAHYLETQNNTELTKTIERRVKMLPKGAILGPASLVNGRKHLEAIFEDELDAFLQWFCADQSTARYAAHIAELTRLLQSLGSLF